MIAVGLFLVEGRLCRVSRKPVWCNGALMTRDSSDTAVCPSGHFVRDATNNEGATWKTAFAVCTCLHCRPHAHSAAAAVCG